MDKKWTKKKIVMDKLEEKEKQEKKEGENPAHVISYYVVLGILIN